MENAPDPTENAATVALDGPPHRLGVTRQDPDDPAPSGWRRVALAAGVVVLFALALFVVQRALAVTTPDAIGEALGAIPAGAIVWALIAAAISLGALVVHDVLALRYTGARVPILRASLASFTANAASSALGAGLLTGGAVRYRLLAGWGLGAQEVALVSTVTTTTTLAGASLLFAVSCFVAPGPIAATLAVPTLAVEVMGAVFLLPPLFILGWALFWRRPVGVGPVRLSPPPAGRALVQLVTTLIDWTAAALVLFFLLPASSPIEFFGFLSLFVVATVAGMASGLPGGLGVFEAVMLLADPTGNIAGLAAALIGYRVIYYGAPLLVAGLSLGARELVKMGARRPGAARVLRDTYLGLLPPLLSILSIVSGAILLWSAATPSVPGRIAAMRETLPLAVIETSHFASSLVGVLLIMVGLSLRRRVRTARYVALALLGAGAILSIAKGGDMAEAAVLLAVLAILLSARDAFDREGGLAVFAVRPGWTAAALVAIASAFWLGFFFYTEVPYTNDLWWTFLSDGDAPRFLRALTGASILLVAMVLWRLMQISQEPAAVQEGPDLDRIQSLIGRAEHAQSDANLALLGDKQFVFSGSGMSFVMFGRRGGRLIAMGPPVGRPSERRELIWRFREHADRLGASPVFYSVRRDLLPDLIDAGFAVQKIGETALVPLTDFNLEGSNRKRHRQAHRRLERDGLTFEVVPPGAVPSLIDEMQAVSDDWLGQHQGKEKTFTLGRFDPAYIAHFPCALIRQEGRLLAFANLWTTADKGEFSMDLMRYHSASPHGVMDTLFVELMLWGRDQGYRTLDLGMAPLAGLEARRFAPILSRLGAFVFDHAEAFYGFEGLRQFKDKFEPEWAPLYLAAPGAHVIPLALGDVALLTSGGLAGMLARSPRTPA